MKTNRGVALALGTLCGPTITFLVGLVILRDLAVVILLSGVCLIGTISIGISFVFYTFLKRNWKHWTPRELFMWPSFGFFLAPLWTACAVIVHEWEKQNLILHYGVAVLLFILIIPALWIFFRLSGTRLS